MLKSVIRPHTFNLKNNYGIFQVKKSNSIGLWSQWVRLLSRERDDIKADLR